MIQSTVVPILRMSISSRTRSKAPRVRILFSTRREYPNIFLESTDGPCMETAVKIMQILQSYSVNCKDNGTLWEDLETFLPTITACIEKDEPVRMALPAFPFKSPNSQQKSMGILPDLGEELALNHLNGLCLNIAQVYEHGAEVHIISDGLVYNGTLCTFT